MKIEINTKFSIGDIVYGFYNGNIWKFRVNDIHVDYYHSKRSYQYNMDYIQYDVVEVPIGVNKDGDECCAVMQTQFYERELHTLDELNQMFEELNENVSLG